MDLNIQQSGIHSCILHTSYFKNRSGKIYKKTGERYLRDDISCGLHDCKDCMNYGDNILWESPSPVKHLKYDKQVLLVDTTSFIQFYDIFTSPLLRNIIITQTVWEGVKQKSITAYKKMHSLCYEDAKDRFHVFMNEFHFETYNDGLKFEHLNRGEELLTLTAIYLKKHWENYGIMPIVVCSNEESQKRIESHYDNVTTLKNYVEGIDSDEKKVLIDQMAAYESSGGLKEKIIFEEYLSHDKIMEGIANGTIKRGNFTVSRENYREASVIIDDNLSSWFIRGNHCNRAVNGDVVAVQLLPESEWTAPERTIRLRDIEENVKSADEMGIEENANPDDDDSEPAAKRIKKSVVPTAKVVGIMKRNWRQYCGMLLPSSLKGARRHLFCPAERLIPRIRIETEQAEILSQKRIVVAIDHWPRDSKYPIGHYVRSIGTMGEPETENEVLLLEHDIPHEPFSDAVMECLPSNDWKPNMEKDIPREDLRHLTICSVDPLGCTDIDDALHCKQVGEDLYEVGVHIADVTHFVRPGTAIDEEAAYRSTTVYLCDRRIDMLPALLSSNLCSLRGNEERYAFSCIWTMTSSADIQSVKFHKSLIKSKAALTYEKAQEIIDDPNEKDDVAEGLRGLMKISKVLNARRIGNGALTLASSEVRFDMDWESRTPKKVMEKKHLDTHSMVEEFMLLANISVAEKILTEYPDCALLRRHPVPLKESYKPLVEAARQRGFDIITESGKGLADSLNRCVDAKNPMLNRLLRMLTTRCMTQALYFSAGTVPIPQYQHFGLACAIYTHFTSPIRRYADVIVHRLLAAAIGADDTHSGLLSQAKVQKICANINYRHKQAQYAGRASVQLNVIRYFKGKKEVCEGFVMGIRKNGIQVFVPKYGLESVIVIDEQKSETIVDMEEMCVKSNGIVVIRELDPVTVEVSVNESNQQRPRIEMNLVKPKISGLSTDFDMTSSEGLGL